MKVMKTGRTRHPKYLNMIILIPQALLRVVRLSSKSVRSGKRQMLRVCAITGMGSATTPRGRLCSPNQLRRPRWSQGPQCTNVEAGPVTGGRSLGRTP